MNRKQIQQRLKDKSKQIYLNRELNEWRVYFPAGSKPDCKELEIECELLDTGCELWLPCSRKATQKEIAQQLRAIKQWEKQLNDKGELTINA